MTFTPEVYEQISEGARRSADVIAPLAIDLVRPKYVADVGCGEGWFARAFAKRGCRVVAIDESVVQEHEEPFEEEHGDGLVRFQPADLAAGDAWAHELASRYDRAGTPRPFPPARGSVGYEASFPFDLVVCLEVAEHLPSGAADAFAATLCALAPVMLFSAAVPGQGGHGHLNEQWPEFWAERFRAYGRLVSGALRWHIWGNDQVEPWYCVPDETEILTDRGWLLREELDGDDLCLQYDASRREFLWAGIAGVNVFDYDGDLVEVAGRWRTTPDHRWPVLSQLDVIRCSGPRWKTAEDVVASDRLVQIAETRRIFPRSSLLSARDAAILGWIVTDGSMRFRASGRPEAVVYQSPKKHLDEVIDLLGEEAASQRTDHRSQSHGCVTVGVRVSALDRLVEAGFRGKEDLPGIVLRLDQGACKAMWNAMMLAEGSRNTGSLVFNQNPGPVADAFQLLSFLLGHRVNLTGSRHCVGGTGKGFKSGRTVAVGSKSLHYYCGKVWCPTTASGTWVMRQNGAIVVTGNCQNTLLVATPIAAADIDDLHDPEVLAREPRWGYGLFDLEPQNEPLAVVHPTTFSYWVEIARSRSGAFGSAASATKTYQGQSDS